MSAAKVGSVPFITRGIIYRNDFLNTGSLTTTNIVDTTGNTFSTDGDIINIIGNASAVDGTQEVQLNLSGSPVVINNTGSFAIRFTLASSFFTTLTLNLYSGSTTSQSIPVTGINQIFGLGFVVFTGSLSNSYIDKVGFVVNANIATLYTGSIDFLQFYTENVPLRYINNSASYALKKRVIPLDAPMREQQIIQTLGSESPVVDLDGVFISDTDFSAQNYRDKLINVWQEGTYQWLQTDFIGAKFIVDDITIDEMPGIVNYYKWTGRFKQYTPISATLQNYNLS